MKLQGENVVMDKEEFLTNSLLAGIACQLLALTSKLEISDVRWNIYLIEQTSNTDSGLPNSAKT
jgi:hypothetical protein